MPWDHPEIVSSRSAEIIFAEIIEISYATQWDDMWWSLPPNMSADLMREFREGGEDIGEFAPITFEWEWPEGKRGTKRGPDGEPTNISSYTLNFDRMEQKNNDTGVVRKFRVVQVGME